MQFMILCCLRFIMFLLNFERLHRFTLSRDAQEPAKCEVGAHCTSRTAFCIGTLRPGSLALAPRPALRSQTCHAKRYQDGKRRAEVARNGVILREFS